MDSVERTAETERTEMINWLAVVVGWNRQIFENMTDAELDRIWKERVEKQ